MYLTTSNHDRDRAGMTYVYPVLSRRAGGVSLGINLNPNNACNWRCIYCQVPDLTRGGPPPLDPGLLEQELRAMLDAILHGSYLETHVPEGIRRLNDLAISGNGEPTSAPEFASVVALLGRVMKDYTLPADLKLVLITNGSQVGKPAVQNGLRELSRLGGEVWFKFDRATRAGLRQANDTECDPERHYQRLKIAVGLCPTWLQTCMFALNGLAPAGDEVDAWLEMLARSVKERLPLRGVLLYGLARPSLQPEANRLSALPETWMRDLAARVEALGLVVKLTP